MGLQERIQEDLLPRGDSHDTTFKRCKDHSMPQMHTQGWCFKICECKSTHKLFADDSFKKNYAKWVRECKAKEEWQSGQGSDTSICMLTSTDVRIGNQLHTYWSAHAQTPKLISKPIASTQLLHIPPKLQFGGGITITPRASTSNEEQNITIKPVAGQKRKELIESRMDQILIGEKNVVTDAQWFSCIDKLLPLPHQAPDNKHGK